MSAPTYIVYNGNMATTAAPTAQPTASTVAVRTMLQIKAAQKIRIVEWGISCDGVTPVTPAKVELIETGTVFATMSTASVLADIQAYGDANAFVQTSGTSGIPLNLGTSATSFATAAVTEGTITATRMADIQMLSNTATYIKQWPLGREFEVGSGTSFRVRVTPGTAAAINVICYVIFEV